MNDIVIFVENNYIVIFDKWSAPFISSRYIFTDIQRTPWFGYEVVAVGELTTMRPSIEFTYSTEYE